MGAVISAVIGAVLAVTLAFTGVNLLASGPDNSSPVDKPLVDCSSRCRPTGPFDPARWSRGWA